MLPVVLILGAMALAAVSIVDVRERRIPNIITYPLWVACLAFATVGLVQGSSSSALGAIVGGALFGAALFLPHRIEPEAMGLGDVKLAVPIGFTIGWFQANVTATIVAVGLTLSGASMLCLAAAMISARRNGRRLVAGQGVPFGPSLSAAGAVAVLVPLL